MIDFARLQTLFQEAVLKNDDTIVSMLEQGAFADRRRMLNVYRAYYKARLVTVLKNNYPLLHAYLGTDTFEGSANAYVVDCPSRHQNARLYSREFSQFLSGSEPFKGMADVCELAHIELAVNDAFDAAETDGHSAEKLRIFSETCAKVPAFWVHPSVTHLSLISNAFAIWGALSTGEEVPPPVILKEPENVFVWRRETKPLVRAANSEEARIWVSLMGRNSFPDRQACAQERLGADLQGGVRAYLGRWFEDGLLATTKPTSTECLGDSTCTGQRSQL